MALYNISFRINACFKALKMTMYFVALVLPAPLNERVLYWKKLMHQQYQCKVGLKSPAHITLVPPFWMNEEKEAELLNAVDSLSRTVAPFFISTKNFSAFRPRTIFIDVEKTGSLTSLKESVDNFFSLDQSYKVKVDSRPFHPHITVATRDLFKKSFNDAWPIFEKEKFEE